MESGWQNTARLPAGDATQTQNKKQTSAQTKNSAPQQAISFRNSAPRNTNPPPTSPALHNGQTGSKPTLKKLYDLYIFRCDEYAAATGKIRPLRIVRKEIDETYRQIVKLINALATLKPSEALTTMMNKLNVSIEKWNTLIAIRQGRIKAEKEKEKANQ